MLYLILFSVYDEDPFDAVRQVEALINDKEGVKYVRMGDLYAVLVVHNVRNENYRKVCGKLLRIY